MSLKERDGHRPWILATAQRDPVYTGQPPATDRQPQEQPGHAPPKLQSSPPSRQPDQDPVLRICSPCTLGSPPPRSPTAHRSPLWAMATAAVSRIRLSLSPSVLSGERPSQMGTSSPPPAKPTARCALKQGLWSACVSVPEALPPECCVHPLGSQAPRAGTGAVPTHLALEMPALPALCRPQARFCTDEGYGLGDAVVLPLVLPESTPRQATRLVGWSPGLNTGQSPRGLAH